MTTRMPCLSCGESGTREERHVFGAVELLGCEDCEATGWRPIAADLAAEHAARTAALREALKGDEVYTVLLGGPDGDAPVTVFGHEDDAKAYRQHSPYSTMAAVRVLDRADARRLIEQEEG